LSLAIGAGAFFGVGVVGAIVVNLLAFFATALVCHGELAKDRPSTRHLTEFYLWMSVGGMVGGMFNGLVAPVLVPGVWEFSIAIVVACLVRPRLTEQGWTEQVLQNMGQEGEGAAKKPAHARHHPARKLARTTEPSSNMSYALDVIIPGLITVLLAVLVFGIF